MEKQTAVGVTSPLTLSQAGCRQARLVLGCMRMAGKPGISHFCEGSVWL